MDTALLLLGSPQGPAGVIAAESERARVERARVCSERVDETLRGVVFAPSSNALIGNFTEYASACDRVVARVCAETSSKNVLGLFLETALEADQVFQTNHPGNTRFRVVIFAGNRFDLLTKASEKQRACGWSGVVVQLSKKVCSRLGSAQRMLWSWRLLPSYRTPTRQRSR